MNKFLWRLVFCLIVIDCMGLRKIRERKLLYRIIDESRYRYKPWLNANDMAYRYLSEINK